MESFAEGTGENELQAEVYGLEHLGGCRLWLGWGADGGDDMVGRRLGAWVYDCVGCAK